MSSSQGSHAEDYQKYMQSSAWRKKREKVLKRDGHVCQVRGCKVNSGLHVHHLTYKRLGNERLSDLITLCSKHHKQLHKGIITMSDIENAPQEINVTTQHMPAQPWYKERSGLDKVDGYDWMMVVALGLTAAMGARSIALAIRVFNSPDWMVIFCSIVGISLILLVVNLRSRMPWLMSATALMVGVGGLIGAVI